MMQGAVSGLKARLPLTFRLAGQPDIAIEFVVDTGFAGALTLPPAAVAALNLTFLYNMFANLADGSRIPIKQHTAIILWDGQETLVTVAATGQTPLLGTELLRGRILEADFSEGGAVRITPRP